MHRRDTVPKCSVGAYAMHTNEVRFTTAQQLTATVRQRGQFGGRVCMLVRRFSINIVPRGYSGDVRVNEPTRSEVNILITARRRCATTSVPVQRRQNVNRSIASVLFCLAYETLPQRHRDSLDCKGLLREHKCILTYLLTYLLLPLSIHG